MLDRVSRLAPLAGMLFAVLAVVAIFTGGGALVGSGVEFGLANEIQHLEPRSVKTLDFIA